MSEPGARQAAAIAAGGDHRHAFGLANGPAADKSFGCRKLEQDADDLVLRLAKPLGAAPSVAVFEQQFFGAGARLG